MRARIMKFKGHFSFDFFKLSETSLKNREQPQILEHIVNTQIQSPPHAKRF